MKIFISVFRLKEQEKIDSIIKMDFDKLAKELGIETCRELDVRWLIPRQRIREFCAQNKCGSYSQNYMCPPHAGSLPEITEKLRRFHYGVLLQYVKYLDIHDRAAVIVSQKDFHNKILIIEEFLSENGTVPVWGLIGGNCRLCHTCSARRDEPCLYPDKARMSLEAIGIDVLELLSRLGLDNQFHNNRVIWTGCVLFN